MKIQNLYLNQNWNTFYTVKESEYICGIYMWNVCLCSHDAGEIQAYGIHVKKNAAIFQ